MYGFGSVVLSEEKSFQNNNDGHVRVYMSRGTKFNEECISHNEINFLLNVWGWLSYYVLETCRRSEEKFNAQTYQRILKYIMLPFICQIYHNSNFIY